MTLPLDAAADALAVAEQPTAPARSAGRPARRRRGWLVRRALLAADAVGLTAAFLAAEALVPAPTSGVLQPVWEAVLFFAVTLPGWVVAARVMGLYARDEERASHTTADDLSGVFQLATLGAWLLVAGVRLTGLAHPDLGKMTVFWALAILFVTLARLVARVLCRRSPLYLQKTLVVGAGDVGQLVARKIRQHPEYGIELVGFVDGDPRPRDGAVRDVPVLGDLEQLPELVRRHGIERVIVAFSRDPRPRVVELVRTIHELDVQVDMVPRFFEVIGARVDLHTLEGLALLGLPPVRLPRSARLLKRAMDLTLAALLLVLGLPALAAIVLAIRLDSPGPVFYRQVRMGRGGRPFTIAKFRTMVVGADERKAQLAHLNKHLATDPRMFKAPDDPRVTRVGRVLRRCSLDELPQLVNVLRGEMSLVGPRPLVLDEGREIEPWARRRLDLKPGVTGLWQVLGRSDIPFEEMLRLDYLYVTGWSLWSDVRLLLRTLPALAGRSGGAY